MSIPPSPNAVALSSVPTSPRGAVLCASAPSDDSDQPFAHRPIALSTHCAFLRERSFHVANAPVSERRSASALRTREQTVRVEPFLLTHEIVEKALLDELRLHYLHAHQIALRAERDAVKAAGVSWWAYQRFMKQQERPIEEEVLLRVPAALDLTPYRDEKDYALLERLVRKERSRR